ncbi:hypothetical protein ACFLQW_03450 [Candidatus Zixiibacteriota bacterium]
MQTVGKQFGLGRWVWLVGAICVLSVIVSCGGDGADSGDQGMLADKTELFDRRYAYLLRGDADFPTLTSRHQLKTSKVEDEVSRVELISDPDRATDGNDSCQIYKIMLKEDAAVVIVYADSIGSGLVSFDFGTLPPGDYTLGDGKFPPELGGWTKECKRLVITLAIGDAIRHRARWNVTEHDRMAHLLDF